MTVICQVCGSEVVRLYFIKRGYKIYSCARCGSAFVFPMPENAGGVYNDKYFGNPDQNDGFGYTNYDKDKEAMREVFISHLISLEKLVPPERSIFDVGAATGYFLDVASSRGWQTSGSEISPSAASEAMARGHKIFLGNLPDMANGDTFDVVTMWDVIEHLTNPQSYVDKIRKILKPGGILAINTPDAGSLFAKVMGKRWHLYVPPEHLVYFTVRSLEAFLVKNGFTVLTIGKPTKKFSIAYIFKTLYVWQGMYLWQWLSDFFSTPLWRNIKVPINLRDNVLMMAKKN